MPRFLLLLLLVVTATGAQAQGPALIAEYGAPGTTGYNSVIPTPEAVLGYRIGERHTTPAEAVRYVQAVAEASDRVVMAEHGTTFGGRPLVHAFVASPAQHARLGAIRQQNLRLSEAPETVTDAELAAMPVVVYLGYSVHGNEASGTEAALLTLYHLAAGEGPAVERVLDEAVVLIDPLLNPDGRDRFADWANRWRSPTAPTADPQTLEHSEPWPGGRTNHYLFDLNRDWLPAQLPESQGRLELFHRWRPQFLADFHEMGSESTFFFQPGIPSRTNPFTPPSNQPLTGTIATYHARAFDQIGQFYYSEESFDDYYYGKGSTYPDVNGAVGVLFEQASSRALERETRSGQLTYATTVRNQFAASLSSLEGVVAEREALLRLQRDMYREAPAIARASEVAAYVVATDRYPQRAAELAATLHRHRIAVHGLAQSVEQEGRRYEPDAAFVVPVDQAQARLVRALFERTTTFQDSLFYDVSAWTLPLAFGLEHTGVTRADGLVGDDWTPPNPGRRVGGEAAYAYLIPWGAYHTPRALYRLQDADAIVRVAFEPFEAAVGGARRRFGRGTLVVPVEQAEVSASEVHRLMDDAVADDGLEVIALSGGLTPEGPDLGSPSLRLLTKPTVAILAGSGASAYRVGEAWHLLSERMHVPVSLIDPARLKGLDLRRYTTIVAAGLSRLDEPDTEALKTWVQGGGTLIATGAGAGWAAKAEFLAATRDEPTPDSTRRPYATLNETRGAQQIGGAIFEVALDTTHPLAFGHPERIAVFKTNEQFFEGVTPGGHDVGIYTEAPRLSGYISEPNLARLSGKAALMAGRLGRGRVVLMDFDPSFRAFWYGTDGLLLNAVFFGGLF
ncbi:MAG: peptidase M14 [Rhodothermaceae bacterium]|nr:peptidase M14 [Rhodothermaceae bacterium]